MKKKLALIVTLIIIILLNGCIGKNKVADDASKSTKTKKIVLASKPMTEQFIIAEILKVLIEQETDIEVEYKEGIGGGTSNIHPAMKTGEIDLYPEYTGTGWMFVLGQPLINDPVELYKAVKEGYKDSFAIVWSELYGFNDTFGIAMKRKLAEEMDIKTYSDLAAKSKELTFGAEHDFFEREDGLPGIVEVYGFDFKKEVGMDIGLKYQAIGSDEVDVINIFSTDGRLKEYDMTVLEDDLNFFPSYYCATLIRQETLDTYPELVDVLDLMTGLINNEEMTNMNYQVEIEKLEASEVARKFLTDNGLLK
ncbi:glycine betaine ABC transporter substrate-binding protein [Oceanispirochaeta crateris]|uniref:glycine betaine ABC transporter substrate-binding protein n=1 Tax=Oceanispirochaeta crateris TaxID=2518645 RepID=UPI00143DB7CE|nr:glycine betaine ABC transporter substrate-binding protein [Oceanispirochaeta crateris]